MPIFDKRPSSRRSLTIWEMGKKGRENGEEIRKQAQWVEVAKLIASRPMKVTKGKGVNGPRKPKE